MVTVFSGRNWKGCIHEKTDLLVAFVVCLPYDSESIAPLYRPSASLSLFVQSSLRLVATLSFVIIVSSDVLLVYQLSVSLAPFLHRFAIRRNVGIVSPFTNLQFLASDTTIFRVALEKFCSLVAFWHTFPHGYRVSASNKNKSISPSSSFPSSPSRSLSLYVCIYLSIYLSLYRRYCLRILISPPFVGAEITFLFPIVPPPLGPIPLSPFGSGNFPLFSMFLLASFFPPSRSQHPVRLPENDSLSSPVSSLLPALLLFYQLVSASSGQGLCLSYCLLFFVSSCLPLDLETRHAVPFFSSFFFHYYDYYYHCCCYYSYRRIPVNFSYYPW